VVGAPHVDHVAEAAVELRLVIGDVGGEISVAAVGFLQRPVDVIAEARGAEQRLLAVLVVLHRRAFRRRQAAFIDLAVGAQRLDGRADLVPPLDQRTLGKEHVMLDVESCEIVTDHRHHHGDRLRADQRQPLGLGHSLELVAVFFRQRRADRLEIVARIQPFGDRADVLAKRLAVAQMRRACQHIDLPSGIVDVVLARHGEAGGRQEIGERIAKHRAAAMADVHRPGRIGRDVFDVHVLAGPDGAAAVSRSLTDDARERTAPHHGIERQVDEPRPRDFGLGDLGKLGKLGRDLLREVARFQSRVLGKRHRRVGGQIAVARLARRLDNDAREIGRRRKDASLGQRGDGGADMFGEEMKDVHAAR
jgi:hypothetical protein